MSFLICLRASLSFLSILAFVIASPCRQKRDSPALDLFASGETPLEDGSLTLAYATNSDADFLSSDYVDPNVSLFSSSIDGSSSAAVDGVAQKIDPDSSATTGSALEGGAPANSEPLFLGTDLEGYSEPTLTAQRLPDFGGITDFSFKGLEEEKLCPADKAPTIPSGGEKVPDTTNEIFGNDGLTPEDKRKCPGSQPIALCCISNFEENEKIQHNCYRRTSIIPRGPFHFILVLFYFILISGQFPYPNKSHTEFNETKRENGADQTSSLPSSGACSHQHSIRRLFRLRIQLGAMLYPVFWKRK